MNFPKENNLQWLRLFFAVQVVIVHAAEHIGIEIPNVVNYFPGVPAFFFVSGLLIYASYINSTGISYYENRFLRIFPALFFVTAGGAAVAIYAHGIDDLVKKAPEYITWIIFQLTLGQAYNPNIFRDVGVGVINGSLWTITTEILFYITVPVIVYMERRFKYVVGFFLLLSFIIYSIGPYFLTVTVYRSKNIYDIVALTPIAWGWMFAFGILAAKHYKCIRPWLSYAPWLIIPMVSMMLFGDGIMLNAIGNRLGLLYFICYVSMVLWFAFFTPFIPLRNDLSYGIYIWHMPIINFLLIINASSFWFVLMSTLAISALSWFLIEKPILKYKRKTINKI